MGSWCSAEPVRAIVPAVRSRSHAGRCAPAADHSHVRSAAAGPGPGAQGATLKGAGEAAAAFRSPAMLGRSGDARSLHTLREPGCAFTSRNDRGPLRAAFPANRHWGQRSCAAEWGSWRRGCFTGCFNPPAAFIPRESNEKGTWPCPVHNEVQGGLCSPEQLQLGAAIARANYSNT